MIIQYTGDRSDSLLADLSEWLDKNADLHNGYTFNIKFLLRIRRLVPGGNTELLAVRTIQRNLFLCGICDWIRDKD